MGLCHPKSSDLTITTQIYIPKNLLNFIFLDPIEFSIIITCVSTITFLNLYF